MADKMDIIKGLHSIQHDILRVITVSKSVDELIPRYDPVIREKIRLLKTQVSDKAVLMILDYMEHVLDIGSKTCFCDMANLIESMIKIYMESNDEPEIEQQKEESENKQKTETVSVRSNGRGTPVYRLMDKKREIRRYKSGCAYDIILEYIIEKLPVDFRKKDMAEVIKIYYKENYDKLLKPGTLDTYAGLYLRCGRELVPPVFKRVGLERTTGRGNKTKYRKTGEKIQDDIVFNDTKQFPSGSHWIPWTADDEQIIRDHHLKMTYREMQKKYLPHRSTIAIESHASKDMKLKKHDNAKPSIHMVDDEGENQAKNNAMSKKERPIKIKLDESSGSIPTEESVSSSQIKKIGVDNDNGIPDFQSLSFPDQIYMYAEKMGWTKRPGDISFLVLKKHFSDKTIGEIRDAIAVLISENKVTQTGVSRVKFRGYKH